MDPVAVGYVLLGTLIGLLTGLVPGLHVNTLAAILLLVLPLEPNLVLLLVPLGVTHTIVNILPSTFLGVPDEEDVLVQLPAHQLYHQGRGRTCVRASVDASFAVILIAVAIGPLEVAFLRMGAIEVLDAITPILLPVVCLILIGQERTWPKRLAALGIQLLAFLTLWTAVQVPLRSVLPVPPSPLTPFLGGAFAVAGMLRSMARNEAVDQHPPERHRVKLRDLVSGHLASSMTGILPGFTGSVAGSMVPRPKKGDLALRGVAVLSAINTNHTILALLVATQLDRIRSGLADAMVRLDPTQTWTATLPLPGTADMLTGVLLAGILASITTVTIASGYATAGARLPIRAIGWTVIVLVVALTAITTGPWGLVLLVASTIVGDAPLSFGVRRVHVVASLAHLSWTRPLLEHWMGST